jgi:hypothetical protein
MTVSFQWPSAWQQLPHIPPCVPASVPECRQSHRSKLANIARIFLEPGIGHWYSQGLRSASGSRGTCMRTPRQELFEVEKSMLRCCDETTGTVHQLWIRAMLQKLSHDRVFHMCTYSC